MIWGAFSANEKFDLAFVNTNMNSTDYQEVLENRLLQFFRDHRREQYVLQQDNARVHVGHRRFEQY
ncbi:unnamed protein product [Cylicostephanus goldi]|uniref:Tc1-like transposase DDE domain-containing protein n=1 Tax=Cylicostephanus goldi TaxID=71465 RepID=A0A3P7MRY4_CYLGO|nr:unnamed protein product [Cylicostephanus goldi]